MKKRYVILIALTLMVGGILFFLSTLSKWYIQKHSTELLGRKISMRELHYNYAKMAVDVKDFTMFEASSKDTFVSFKELYINFDPLALLKKEFAFSEIRLVNPRVTLVQNGSHFNFDDLMASSDTLKPNTPKDTVKSNVRFLVQNISISGGHIGYTDQQIKNHLVLRNLNLNIPSIAWDSHQSDVGISFRIGKNGTVKLKANLNNQNQLFTLNLDTRNIDLNMFTNYLKSYMNIKDLLGELTSSVSINGNLNNPSNALIKGQLAINGLVLTDLKSSDILRVGKFFTSIKTIDPGKNHYSFSEISAQDARLIAILNKKGSNLTDFLSPYFLSDSISRSKADTTQKSNELPVSYSIDTIRLVNASILFQDNTLNRPFAYDFKNISLSMINLSESATDVPIRFALNLNDKGKIQGDYTLNMNDLMSVKTHITLSKLDLTSFSPYSEYYIASPIIHGYFTYKLSLELNKRKLVNTNAINFDHLKFGKRTHDSTAVKVPIRLALYILKDKDGQITFDLPVEGDPSEPKFSVSKIVWKTLGNFFVKVASEPFKAMGRLFTSKPDDIDKMPFQPLQDSLSTDNLKIVHQIADIIRQKDELKFHFVQYTNTQLEKEQLAVILAKNQYVKEKNPQADSLTLVELSHNLSTTNEDFKTYLNSKNEQGQTLDPVKACVLLIGEKRLENELLQKINSRNWSLQKALGMLESLPESSFRIETADLRNLPEELKTTTYRIEVMLKDE